MRRLQTSLERVGLDASKAVARAHSRSVSRVGRKRLRDAPAGVPEAMDVDGSQAPEKKRIHSAKSRHAPLWLSDACAAPSLAQAASWSWGVMCCHCRQNCTLGIVARPATAATLAHTRVCLTILPVAHICSAMSCGACAGQCPAGER